MDPKANNLEDIEVNSNDLQKALKFLKVENNMLQNQIGKVISFRYQFDSLCDRIDKLERFIDLVNGNLEKIDKIAAYIDQQASDDVVVKTNDYFQSLIDQTKAALMLEHTAGDGNTEGESEEDIIGRNLRNGLFQSIPVVRMGDYITSCTTSADFADLKCAAGCRDAGEAAAAESNLDENANTEANADAVINVDEHADAFAEAADVDVGDEEEEQEQEEDVDSGADVGSDEDTDSDADENPLAASDPDTHSNEDADVDADDEDGSDSFEEENTDADAEAYVDAVPDNDPNADTDSDVDSDANGDADLEAVADAANAAN